MAKHEPINSTFLCYLKSNIRHGQPVCEGLGQKTYCSMTAGDTTISPQEASTGMAEHDTAAVSGSGEPCRSRLSSALESLLKRTGYQLQQENGQRRYGGPPPGWDGAPPPRGCQVFVGKIPRDCYEDELVPALETAGCLYELRLMVDGEGRTRGYAFATYIGRIEARAAVRLLDNHEIRPGRLLGVCSSVDNCRLFVGGIPKTARKDEILREMKCATDGVTDVIVYASAADKSRNRGFAFVEYESHRAAAAARRKLLAGGRSGPQLWGQPLAVDWAEPEPAVDEEVMKTVKVLYVRNLMLTTTEDALRYAFEAAAPGGTVERVKKIRDYAFVHFSCRDDALRAMTALHGTDIDGACVEVMLAKPVDREQYQRYQRATKGIAQGTDSLASSYLYPTYDPYGLTYFGYGPACSSTIGPGRDYVMKVRDWGLTSPSSSVAHHGGYSAGRSIYSRYHEHKEHPGSLYELVPSIDFAALNPTLALKSSVPGYHTLPSPYTVYSGMPLASPKAMEEKGSSSPDQVANHGVTAAIELGAGAGHVLPAVNTSSPGAYSARHIGPVYALSTGMPGMATAAGAYYTAGYIPVLPGPGAVPSMPKSAIALPYSAYPGFAFAQPTSSAIASSTAEPFQQL
uniref:RNA-binding protein 47-like isoform X1 n=2 Tax=Myxine glutinosa TaxID=7769 RepID=UPI00358ED5BD